MRTFTNTLFILLCTGAFLGGCATEGDYAEVLYLDEDIVKEVQDEEVEDIDQGEDIDQDEGEDEDEDIDETEDEDEIEDEQGEEIDFALPDYDTFENPLAFENFAPTASPRFIEVNNDISSGFGDPEDWIGFHTIASQSTSTRVDFSLTCTGDTNGFSVRIWDNEGPSLVPLSGSIGCTTGFKRVSLDVNHDYLAQVHYHTDSDEPRYTEFTLLIEN